MNALGEDVPAASAGAEAEESADIEGRAEASEEVGEEQRKAIVKRDPKQPTRDEIELHEATGHVSHRSWCLHCQRARATAQGHRRNQELDEPEGQMPTLSLDYCYMNDGEEERALPCLLVKCHRTKRYWANTLPAKGTDPFAVARLKGVVNEAGFKQVLLKSDGEPAIVALKQKVKEDLRDVEIHLTEVPVEDHRANGFIEVGVRELKRQVRAILSDLQDRLGFEIDPTHPCLVWLARHAAFLLTRFRVGTDGKTAYERTYGRSWRTPLVRYGEHILYRPRANQDGRRNDIAPRVSLGMYVGTGTRNSDVFVMTERGIMKGNSLSRRPPEEQFKYERFGELRGLPWRLQERLRDAGEMRIPLPDVLGERPARPAQEEVVPRNLYVKRSDIEEFGTTPFCPGCEAAMLELPNRAHNAECRFRIQTRLLETEKGQERVRKARARVDAGRRQREAPGGGDEIPAIEDGAAEGAVAEEPVLLGRPEPDSEMAAGEAAGEPETRSAPRELESREEAREPKRQKTKAKKGDKRPPEVEVEELHEREQNRKNPGGEASSSRGEGQLLSAAEPPGPDASSGAGGNDSNEMNLGCLCAILRKARKEGVISEIFSPPRVAAQAQLVGMRPGFSVDLETKRADGEYWDLSKDRHVEDLMNLIDTEKPEFLGGSPPCGPFSNLQNLVDARNNVEPKLREKRLKEGKKHLRTAVKGYRKQLEEGRYFLHEHPKGAKSWEEKCIKDLAADERVYTVEGPMCRWQMESSDLYGKGLVYKMTRWMTNSRRLAEVLEGVCSNSGNRTWHRHVNLINGRARAAQIYPPKLVKAILVAMRRQLEDDGEFNQTLNAVEAGPVPDAVPVIDEEEEKFNQLPEASEEWEGPIIDANTGAVLDPKKVKEARDEELAWVHKQQIYKKVPISECEQEGKVPITMKWIDRNKGDLERPNYRSRLVCREVKRARGAEYIPEHASFSAMPPLEALKLLLSLMVTLKKSRNGSNLKLRLLDISRAHFYGNAERRVFVTLPEGDKLEGHCGLLLKSMYGTRDAANIWQRDYTELLLRHNFTRSNAWPAVLYHREKDVRLLVHGDDFVILADDQGQAFLKEILETRYELRIDGSVGPGEEHQAFTVLNRVVSYCERSGVVTYEPDPRHAEMVLKQLDLETCKPVRTPGEKQSAQDVATRMSLPTVPPDRVSFYRSLVMRIAFLSQDRPDLSEATKCLARRMAGPNESDFKDLKRLGRYLRGTTRMVQKFYPQKFCQEVTMYVDSDFAGCLMTRRSTSGLVCLFGRHVVKHSSTLQSTISLSSGESEFYAIVKGVATGYSIQELLRGWNVETKLKVKTDSSAALGTCNRIGLGKSRHVQTRFLWVQEQLAAGYFELEKVETSKNIADICTKSLNAEAAGRHVKSMSYEVLAGRSTAAKSLVT